MPEEPKVETDVAQTTPPVETPTVAPALETPKPPATKTLAQEYDMGDASYDAEIDAPPSTRETPPAAPVTNPAPAGERKRGPDGRFLEEPPKSQSHPKGLTRQATELGFSEAEIAGTPTEELANQVYAANRAALAIAREHGTQATLQQGSQRQKGASVPPGTLAPETAAPAEDEYDLAELGIVEADWDPRLVKALKKLGGGQRKQIKELEQQLAQVHEREATRVNMSLAQRIDRQFAKLNHPLLGQGRGRDMQEGDPQFALRKAVLAVAQTDKSAASLEEKIDKAVRSVFKTEAAPPPAAAAAADSPELAARKERWNGAGLQKPTQRQPAAEPDGDKKAIQTAGRIMRQHGMLDDEDFPDDAFLD